jgi:hypothetical protein
VAEESMLIDFKPVQPLKLLWPKVVSVRGMVISFNPVQPWKQA